MTWIYACVTITTSEPLNGIYRDLMVPYGIEAYIDPAI